MAPGGNTDGVGGGGSSAGARSRLRLATLAELFAQGLHGLQERLMHILGHH